MRKKVMKEKEYSKLSQADEEIACQYVSQPKHRHENDARKRLITACLFCTVFIVCEIAGGFIANSLAIMNDALHQFFDLNSLVMSLIASWIARWKPNEKKTFGYYRAEILGACAVILTLWLLTGILVYESVLRLFPGHVGHHSHVNSDVMILTAALAFGANIVIICLLNVHSHHGHSGHQHCETNITIRAAFLHTLGDVFHSFAVLIGAILIKINPSWEIADPILSLFGAFVVLLSTFSVLRDSTNVLMEGVPSNIRLAEVKRELMNINHVRSVHDAHVWALTAGQTILSAHVVIDPTADVNVLMGKATQAMAEKYRFYKTCLQVEIIQSENGINLVDQTNPEADID
ncbi:proton-coupled zinc antiporter SLC30A8-like [Montipora capricornis]|uniref:proton-coupled zinc antiporter SLC30A8-like n=1 Tax=Montipora foliosa TaxID=591990 RepID=UPI0035F122CF